MNTRIARKILAAILVLCLIPFSASAEVIFHITEIVDGEDVYDSCNDETVLLYAESHFKITQVEKNGEVTQKTKYNLNGFGIGTESGTQYSYNENVHTSQSGPDLETYSTMTEGYARLISEGYAPNRKLKFTLVREYIDGEMVFFQFFSDIVCIGPDK